MSWYCWATNPNCTLGLATPPSYCLCIPAAESFLTESSQLSIHTKHKNDTREQNLAGNTDRVQAPCLPFFFPAPPWMSQLSVSHCFLTLRSSYLANIFLVGHKVMESEVHHVRARYNSQSLKQKGAVRVIQIKNFSELLALQNKQNRSGQGKNEANCTWKKVNRTQRKHWPKSTASFLAFAKLFNAIFLVFPYFSFLFWSLHYLHPSRNNTLRPTSLHKHAVLV